MANFKEGNLEIIFEEGNTSTLRWKGKSEDRDPSAVLNPYFDSIVSSLSNKPLEIDFLSLEYMNSSTVPPIIQLIKNLNNSGIKTVISYDKNSKWQSASFKALETIARTMDNIDVVGK